MSDVGGEWDGWALRPDGTIFFAAVVTYEMLAVPSGAIIQFLHAYNQEEMDSGQLHNIQLHLAADKVRECGEMLLQMADAIGAP